jgi:hypothetical protein
LDLVLRGILQSQLCGTNVGCCGKDVKITFDLILMCETREASSLPTKHDSQQYFCSIIDPVLLKNEICL